MHKQLRSMFHHSLPALAVTGIIVSFFALAPAAEAAPWWWVVFSKGDDVSSVTSAVEAWPAWAVDNAAVSDTVYISSFTFGTGNLDLFNGINGLGTTGINALAGTKGGANPNNYIFVDNDDSITGGIQTVSPDADNDTRIEPSNSNDAHNKLIVIPGKYVITGSMNFTSGAASAQPNDLLQIRVPAVINRYVSQMEEFRANTWHDNSATGGPYYFNSANGDTIEVYFSPDDNNNIPTGSGPGNADAGGDVGGDPANATVEGVVCRVLREANQSCFYMVNIFTSSDEFDSANIEAHLRAFPASGRLVEGAWEILDGTPANGMRDRLQANHESRDGATPFTNQFHAKFMVIDQDIVITGSGNYTASAMVFTTGNDENKVVINDFRLARKYLEYYRRIISTQVPTADGVGTNTFETTRPSPVTGFSVTPQASSFNLNWTASPSGDVTRYFVFIDSAPIDTLSIGDGVDNDADGLYDEDPRGDADQFPSGTSTADKTANDDDCDGSSDEDLWMWPEIQVKGRTSATATVSTCNVGEALQPGVNYYFAIVAVDTHGNESVIDTEGPHQLGVAGDTTIEVTKNSDIASANVAKGSTYNVVLRLRVNGDTQYDYLKSFAVECTGSSDTRDIRNVRLWHDANDDSAITGGIDTIVDTLVYNTGTGWWHATALTGKPDTNIAGDTGNNYLVSVDIYDTATEGATVVFRVPASSCLGNRSGTGPASAVTNAGILTIPSPDAQIIINEVFGNPGIADHDGDGNIAETDEEFVELYNPGPDTVDLGSWKIRDNAGAGVTLPGSPLNLGPYQFLIAYAGTDSSARNVYIYDRERQLGNYAYAGTWASINNTNDSANVLNDAGETIASYSAFASTTDSPDARMWDSSATWDLTGNLTAGYDSDVPRFNHRSPNAYFSVSANPVTITAGDTTLLTITACASDNTTLTTFTMPAVLSVSAGSLAPGTSGPLTAGVGTVTVTPSGATGSIIITAAYATTTFGTTTVTVNAGTPSTNLAVTLAGTVTDTNVYPGGTNIAVLAVKITGDTYGDTLTQFAVRNLGLADSADVTVKMWKDNNSDSKVNAGDTLIATLISGGADTWYRNSIPVADSSTLSGTGSYFLVTIDIAGGATIGDTFQAQVAAYSCDAFYFDSGPTTAVTNTGKATIATPPANNITVDTRGKVPSANVSRGDSYVVAITLKLSGSPSGDTLVRFAVQNLGTAAAGAGGISAVKLWRDNNSDSAYDAGDSLVAVLANSGDTWYANAIPPADSSALAGAGSAFLVTVDIGAGATNGVTFRAAVPATACDAATFDSGPAAAIGNPGTLTVSVPDTTIGYDTQIVINEFCPDPGTATMDHDNDSLKNDGDEEFIELYNLGPGSVDVGGWTISDTTTIDITLSASPVNLPANGFLIVYADTVPAKKLVRIYAASGDTVYDGLYTGTWGALNQTTDWVRVQNDSAQSVDSCYYATSTNDKSWSALWDGADTLTDGHSITPGRNNDPNATYNRPSPNAYMVVSASPASINSGAATTISCTVVNSDSATITAFTLDANISATGCTSITPSVTGAFVTGFKATACTIAANPGQVIVTVSYNTTTSGTVAVTITSAGAPGDTVPPNDITGLSATAGHHSATLRWAATTATDSSQYRIYYDTQPITNVLDTSVTFVGSLACNLGDTDYVVSGLTNDTICYFAVTATDTTGNEDTYPSVTASCTPTAPKVRLNEILADPPTGADVNGDSNASASTDEFIELYNYGATAVDLSGCRLLNKSFSSYTLPAGTVVPAFGYLTVFLQDDTSVNYLLPGLVLAGNTGVGLVNTNDTVYLLGTAGDTLDSRSWGAEGGNNQSLTWTATGWQMHEVADTIDCSSYSPGVGLVAVGGSIITDIAAGFAEKGDTDTVLLAFRLYGNRGGDVLVNFRVANVGTAVNTDLKNMRLVRDWDSDAAFDTPVGDSVVATLAWYAADTSWRAYGLNHALADTLNARFLVVADIDTPAATVGRTIQLRLSPYGSRTAAADSGPVNPTDSNAYVLTVKDPSPIITATIDTNTYYAGIYPNSSGIPALAIFIANSWGQADTITSLTVQAASPYGLDSRSVGTVRAWVNAGDTARLDGSDSLVTTLSPYVPGQWRTSGLSLTLPAAGLHLLFTLEATATPVMGDSVMLQVPANGITAATAESGPMAAITNGKFQFVSRRSVVLSEIEVDVAGAEGAGGEYVELYNPTGTPVSLNGWRLQYVSAGSDPYTWPGAAAIAVLGQYDSVPAYGFYMLGAETSGITPNYYSSTFSFASTGGHIVLRNDSFVIIDLFGYGNATAAEGDSRAATMATGNNQVYERKADSVATSATMGTTDIWAGNGYDSDFNYADWVVSTANPQNAFSETEPRPLPPGDTVPPADIIWLSAYGINQQAILLWTATSATDSSQYRIYYDTQPIVNVTDTSVSLAGTLACNLGDTDYVVSGLTNGTRYYFAVTATDTTGNEDTYPSATASCTPAFINYTVRISEVLADPPAGADLNGDGLASTASDEFVEIWNYDSAPVNMSYCQLLNEQAGPAYTAMLLPAGTIVPAYGYLLAFMSDSSVTGYYPFPGAVVAGDLGINLTNGSDTIYLVDPAGDTLDTKAWGAEGGNNQSLHWTAAGWQQHESADTIDASSYSPGTALIAVNGSIITDIPAGFADKGDTDTVLLAFRLYGNRGGDVLVNFRVTNVGTAVNTDLKNMRLVRDWDSDAAFDTPVGDSVVATLAWYAADTSWRAYGLNHALADTLNARFLVVADIDTPAATVGRTIQLRLSPYGSRTAAADSGPVNPTDSNAYVLTVKEPTPAITATIDTSAYYAGIYPNSSGIPALAVFAANSWGQADTITSLTVQAASPYGLDSRSVGTVRAWVNAGDTARLDGSDSLVTTLNPYIPGQWRTSGLSLTLPAAGLHLLFTLEATATPVMGDSVMLQVPANGITAATAESGPMAAITNGKFQFVSRRSVVLSEIEVDVAGAEGAGGEYVELYNPTGTPVSLNGWRLQYVSAGSDPYTWPGAAAIAVLGQYDSVPAYGFYMLGAETSGITPNYYEDTFSFTSTGGHIVLRNDSFVVIDLFGYGNATAAEGDSRAATMATGDNQVYERKACDTSTAATMAGSDLLAGNGRDSDCNYADWVVSVATPQNAFSETEPRARQRVAIDTMRVVPDSTVLTGAARVLVLAVRITGSPAGDTLTAFTVRNPGTALATDISVAQLWRDVNADSQWNAADLLVTNLTNSGDTWYVVNADTSLAGAGSAFLVTVDIAGGAVSGRTFQAQVPVLRSDAQVYTDGGPADTVTNTGVITIGSVALPPAHLLLSEVAYGGGEFIEIWNPNDTPVTLTNYFLSDDPRNYFKIVDNTQAPAASDFIVRFPAGTVLAGQDTVVVCINSAVFIGQHPGIKPDFEVEQDGAGDGIADMLDSGVGGSAGLSNTSEPVILYYWNGVYDLVQDVDVVVWGTSAFEYPNKSGISIDSLYDTDGAPSAYAADDTSVTSYASGGASAAQSIRRIGFAETGEDSAGGNGIASHDETTESMALTWSVGTPSPWHTMLVAYRYVALPFAYARQGDTLVEVLSFFVSGARSLADNLTRVTMVNTGTLSDTGVKRVWLYHDANGDGAIDGGDNNLGTLAWTGSAWETTALAYALPAAGDTFIIAIDVNDTATDYDTFAGRINAYGLAAATSDSGSFTAIANPNAVMIASLAAVLCYVPDTLATSALHTTDLNAVVAVLYLSTNLGWADTLTALTLRSTGSMNDSGVARLSLWADDGDSRAGGGDTFVANFAWNGTRWDTSGLAYPIAAGGTKFIVTLLADNRAGHGDTLQLLVPAGGCTFATAFAGPLAADTVGYPLLLVETSPLVFSEVFYDPLLPRQEFIELKVLAALDPSGWRIKDYDLGASSVDYTIPDTCPALQPGDLLVLRMDTGIDDIDRTDGDVVFFLSQNGVLSGTGDPLTLRDTDSQFRDFIAIESGSNDGDLPALAPYVFCGWPNNGAAPANGATATIGRSLILAGADIDDSSTWTFTDTPTEGRSTIALVGELPADSLYAGDTRAVLAFTISDGSYADTLSRLDRLRVTNLGTLTAAELYAVTLYADNGDSAYGAGDTSVAALAWDGSGWGAIGIGLTGLNQANRFIIAVALRDTATHNATFRASIPAYGVGTAYADSGPLAAVGNAASFTARTQFIVAVDSTVTVPAASVAPGAGNALALALRITGHELGDTLTVFSVTNLGDGGSDTAFTAVRLWRDENASNTRDAFDTLVASLSRSGTVWSAAIAAADSAVLAGAGTAFILTVDVDDSATLGETFQARIAVSTVDAARADSGPLAVLTGNVLTVSIATYAITGTAPLQGLASDSGTILYLYDLGGSLVDSATIDNASGTFSLSAVNGTYYLYLVGPHHLAVRVNGVIVSGGSFSLAADSVPEAVTGDIIRDNVIDILDASYLRGHFNSSDSRADLNNNGLANEADMLYIRQNFGRRGASNTP